jgi:hypothetical protein
MGNVAHLYKLLTLQHGNVAHYTKLWAFNLGIVAHIDDSPINHGDMTHLSIMGTWLTLMNFGLPMAGVSCILLLLLLSVALLLVLVVYPPGLASPSLVRTGSSAQKSQLDHLSL